jgi:hypothetical protein
MKYSSTVFLATALLIWGCDRPEPIPAFLRIEPFKVAASAGGDAMHEIDKGWVYINNELLGGFELPVEIPVLWKGDANILVFPGVTANGQNDSPSLFAPMERHRDTVFLEDGQTEVISPKTKYEAALKYAFPIEKTTFDGPTAIIFEDRDLDVERTFLVNTDGGLDGRGMLMQVDTGHILMEVASEAVALPNSGAEQVWLELHHSNDVPFSIQIVSVADDGFEEAIPLFFANATEDGAWNKLYLNLTDYLTLQKKPKYRVFFRLRLPIDTNGQPTAITGKTKLDNIRLIHF